jgi:Tfp pilus assembly protein PilF
MKRNYRFFCFVLSFFLAGLAFAQEDPKVEAQKAYNEGLGLLKKNQTAQAIEKLNNAVSKDPDLAIAYYALGIAHKRTKQISKAEAMYKKAIEKDDKMVNAYNALGNLYAEQQNYDSAINTYTAFWPW